MTNIQRTTLTQNLSNPYAYYSSLPEGLGIPLCPLVVEARLPQRRLPHVPVHPAPRMWSGTMGRLEMQPE